MTGPNPSGLCMCGCGERTRLAPYSAATRQMVKGEPVRFVRGHQPRRCDWPEPNPSGLCGCGCGQATELAAKSDRAAGTVKGKPQRYVLGHGPTVPTDERYWALVDRGGPNGCWIWVGVRHFGYGRFMVSTRREAPKCVAAHRFSYERLVGPIPLGLDLDHLCRNRACVNPAHLEPVTRQVNIARGFAARKAEGNENLQYEGSAVRKAEKKARS